METARKNDPDRFLLSLFAPAKVRPDLWALYAFNHEIAKTREVVTETQLGLIRLQWWRNALAGIYERDEVLQHYVVGPLAAAIRRHNLPRELFDNLIYAREFDLEDRLPSNLEGMTKYAEFTSAPLVAISSAVISSASSFVIPAKAGNHENTKVDPRFHADGERAGTIYAMTGLLRAVPHHARQRRCYLPEDMLRVAGVEAEDIYEGKALEKLPPVVKIIVDKIKECHPERRGGSPLPDKIPRAARDDKFRKLHVKLADMYLKQIEKAGYDLFSPRLKTPPLFKEIRLWWAA